MQLDITSKDLWLWSNLKAKSDPGAWYKIIWTMLMLRSYHVYIRAPFTNMINFNSCMDNWSHPLYSVGWNYLSIPKLQRCNRWSLGMDKQFHPTLYWTCGFLFMLALKPIHVSKWDLYVTIMLVTLQVAHVASKHLSLHKPVSPQVKLDGPSRCMCFIYWLGKCDFSSPLCNSEGALF